MPTDDLSRSHGLDWLNKPVTPQPDPEEPRLLGEHVHRRATRPRRSRIVALGAAAGILTGAVAAVAVDMAGSDHTDPAASATPTTSITPTSTVAATARACTGLTAQTVTAGAGDTTTLAGVIAAFEYAYYVTRSAEDALRLVTPQAGITLEPLAAAITALPAGTTHCVGITPIAENTAEVHLVELHPDGRRFDYLQVINVAATPPAGLVITNIQKRGS
ncbi:hypothetical protein NN3_00390 [Nocardia neocaledoniensis NBRC 108232]|uniref:DUF8176 domain-containing protein n=1 Tax=Nocardia neocaledoniensis TaxID=236511 RepID=A0A317NH87_9NOCA|nr:hypothetical protein [Nocardia neocaledoniensis]PWV74472.1 hypothetical protein DFR69_106283 [Nocardia neocaledoniensis]GEM29032.1 hypothetical protein NN3_00390 [Nocardia neocaledoniensis NBRC 108232]